MPSVSVSQYINGALGSEGPAIPLTALINSPSHYNNMTKDK